MAPTKRQPPPPDDNPESSYKKLTAEYVRRRVNGTNEEHDELWEEIKQCVASCAIGCAVEYRIGEQYDFIDDVVQETLIQVFHNGPQWLLSLNSPGAMLSKIASRRMIDMIRKERKRRLYELGNVVIPDGDDKEEDDSLATAGPEPSSDDAPDSGNVPCSKEFLDWARGFDPIRDRLAYDRLLRDIEECSKDWSSQLRTVLRLFIEGDSPREMAEELGIKANAASQAKHRMLLQLKDCLQRKGYRGGNRA